MLCIFPDFKKNVPKKTGDSQKQKYYEITVNLLRCDKGLHDEMLRCIVYFKVCNSSHNKVHMYINTETHLYTNMNTNIHTHTRVYKHTKKDEENVTKHQ